MKILLVQTSFLGDTILSTPVIAGIHRAFPNTRLWMMTTPASEALVKHDPLLEGIIPFDKRSTEAGIFGILKMAARLKSMNFDMSYVLHRSYRTAILLKLSGIPVRIGFKDAKLSRLYTEARPRNLSAHDVLRNLSLLKKELPVKYQNTELRLFSPDQTEISKEVKKRLPPDAKYVLIVPGSVWPTKMWFWEGYRAVVKYLLDKGYPVVLDGAPGDADLLGKISKGLNTVNLAGKSSIRDAMYLVKNARLVVCNDSMALHMAAAFKTPNVAIFCATSPSSGFYPWKNKHIVVEKNHLPCKPCGRHGGKNCPTGTNACMTELQPEAVITAIERLLH